MASNTRIYARAIASVVPVPRLGGRSGELPDVTITRRVRVEREAVARFCAVVREPLRDVVPASYLHTLGFMPAMEAMTDPGFPVPVLGMVHTRNHFEQRAATRIGDELELTVTLGAARAHKRGTEIPVRIHAQVDGTEVFREECLYLAQGKQLAGAQSEEQDSDRLPFDPDAQATAFWKLDRSVPPEYAGVSGDLNPIHINRLAAKAFGFPATIAHGMYTAARGLAQVGLHSERFTWDVQFASPLVLPTTVGFSSREESAVDGSCGPAIRYQVFNPRKRKPYVVAVVTVA